MTAPEPRANPELLGHGEAEAVLRTAWDCGRLAHAWLITGPEGIGKATLAFRFARFVLAQSSLRGEQPPTDWTGTDQPSPLHIDPTHTAFQRAAGGGHSDLRVVERTLNEKSGKTRAEIVVEQVRSVRSLFIQTTAEGGWRVVIIDAADEMNPTAQNALLKMLEEPPDRTILLLVCHRPARLLPTVRSRCRTLALTPLTDPDVAALLRRWQPDLPEDQRDAVVQLAAGSIGRALTLTSTGGAAVISDIDRLLVRLPDMDLSALDRFGDSVARPGADALFGIATATIQDWVGDLALAKGGAPRARRGRPDVNVLSTIAGRASLDRWLDLWDKVGALFRRVESANLDRKQVILTAMLSLREAARERPGR